MYQNTISILPAGSSILFIAHTPVGGGASLTFTADSGSGATVEHASLDWDADFGFEVDDVVIIDYHNSGDPLYAKVGAISGTTLTLVTGVGDVASIVTGSGVASTQLHAATPIEVSEFTSTCD